MKEQLVSWETAKLAKEKGYDEPSKTTYNKDKEVLTDWLDDMYNSKFTTSYVAPTQSLLQKWLRDQTIVVLVDINQQFGYTWKIVSKREGGFKATYEEAFEAGLWEALKLINNK